MSKKKVVRYQLVKHKWPDEVEAERTQRQQRNRVILVCILCFVAGLGVQHMMTYKPVTKDETFDKFSEVYDVMSSDFYFGANQKDFNEKLIKGAIDGMVYAGNDRHTMYMDAQESEDFTTSMEGSVVGIGVVMYSFGRDGCVIQDVIKDSPAEKAGLLPGDVIYAVNDKDVTKESVELISALVRGEEGTEVKLEIVRDHTHMVKTMTRQRVEGSVFSHVENGVAHIELRTFAQTSGSEFGRHLEDLKADHVHKIILDLRGNGGGYLQSALEIASYFIAPGEVVFKEDDGKGEQKEYKAMEGLPRYQFDTLVVLVDGNSASASETLTAALQEQAGAIVVGTKTYGKGTIQTPMTFEDGSMLKYTVGEWVTPSGKKINKKGITPDVVVEQAAAYELQMPALKDAVIKPDTVDYAAKAVQSYLSFLGYRVDREDEYFSFTSSAALAQYQKDQGLKPDGNIRAEVCSSLVRQVMRAMHEKPYTYDLQLKKAMEVAYEK